MPEQLTKYPDVTIQVLASAGAQCGKGLPQEILKSCPAERFCKLPGGEMCVYGLPEAGKMTQVSPSEWKAVLSTLTSAVPSGEAGTPLAAGGLGLLAGAVLGCAVAAGFSRRRRAR